MKIKLISIISLTIFLNACSSWINPSMNTSPNSPSDVTEAQLVPAIEANLAYGVGGEIARFTCQWTQQIAGLQSQAADYDIYNFGEADDNNDWSYYLYSPGMINTKILMEKAAADNSPWYEGIGEVLMAYHLGVTTDLWGDIPYSDAFNGAKLQFQSKYDTQQKIYSTIDSLLNSAIGHLQATSSMMTPGSDDMIYGGDLTQWIKTAYALKARYSLHLSKINGQSAYTDALTDIAKAYTSNSDDFKYTFGSAYSNSNPNYQFQDQRGGYYGANSFYMNMLRATNDPRDSVYFASGDTISSASGQFNANASPFGANYASPTSPVYLMSYAELMFIKAEACFETGDLQDAADAYNSGLEASLNREGVFRATWFVKNQITAGTITLEKIIDQKYLCGFLQMETFNDWRRTGYPKLSPAIGAVISGGIPRRFPYPQDERLYNSANMPTGITLLSRVWWDTSN